MLLCFHLNKCIHLGGSSNPGLYLRPVVPKHFGATATFIQRLMVMAPLSQRNHKGSLCHTHIYHPISPNIPKGLPSSRCWNSARASTENHRDKGDAGRWSPLPFLFDRAIKTTDELSTALCQTGTRNGGHVLASPFPVSMVHSVLGPGRG